MKRVLMVLALTGSTVLVPTAAFAADTTGGVTMVPVFVVSGGTGGAVVDTPAVAGPPLPLGPFPKHGPDKDAKELAKAAKEEAKDVREAAKQEAKDVREAAKQEAKDVREAARSERHGPEALSGLASVPDSPWDDAALISGGGRTFG